MFFAAAKRRHYTRCIDVRGVSVSFRTSQLAGTVWFASKAFASKANEQRFDCTQVLLPHVAGSSNFALEGSRSEGPHDLEAPIPQPCQNSFDVGCVLGFHGDVKLDL